MVWWPAGIGGLSPLLNVCTGSGAYPVTYSVGTDNSVPRTEATVAWGQPYTGSTKKMYYNVLQNQGLALVL